MMEKEVIRDYYGRILGTIWIDAQGNKTARDFYGRILGKYDKKLDVTRDFYGRIIGRGDRTSSLIPMTRTK